MTSNIELEECLTQCIQKNNTIIQELYGLIRLAEGLHKNNNVVKTVGTGVSVAGAGVTMACVVMAPFTGGLSIAGLAGGGLLSLYGGAMNIGADFNARRVSKNIIDTIKSLLDSRETLVTALKEQIDTFNRLVENLVSNGVSPEIARSTLLQGIANGSINLKNVTSYDLMIRTALCASRLLEIDTPLIAQSALLANTSIKSLNYLFGLSVQATTTIFRTITTGVVFLSIAFVVIDIRSVVNSWSTAHPTVPVINDVIKQLTDEVTSYENFVSVIDSFKERVYISTMDNIPITGSISEFNDVTVALFNNDILRCKELLERIEIDWLFPTQFTSTDLAIFISQYNIATRFDKQKLKAIIEKTDKQARVAIETKVQLLLSQIQNLSVNATNSDDAGRSRRKEDVINTNVVSCYKDVIDKFVQCIKGVPFIQLLGIPHESQIYKDYHQALPDHIKKNIFEDMRADIPETIIYINANSLIYGTLKYILLRSAKLHMNELYNDPNIQGSIYTSKIKSTVAIINRLSIFVDQVAKVYWLQQGGNTETFEESRLAVQAMLSNLSHKMKFWVEEIRRYA